MAIAVELGNPIRVTGTTSASSKVIDPAQSVYVRSLYWFNPTLAAHLCTLKTSKGHFIAELRGGTDGVSVQLEIDAYFDDIYCTDMDSGTLYIYTR